MAKESADYADYPRFLSGYIYLNIKKRDETKPIRRYNRGGIYFYKKI